MKSFATIMFASGALAAMAPPAYAPAPAVYPSEHKTPAVYAPYPTGGHSSSSSKPHESAPYPYSSSSAKETSSTKSAEKPSSTSTEHAPVYVTKTYEHETMKPSVVTTHEAKTYTKVETEVHSIPVYGHASESSKVMVHPTTYPAESSKTKVVVHPTTYPAESSKTEVMVHPTTYPAESSKTEVMVHPTTYPAQSSNTETATEHVYLTVSAPAVCVPVPEQTVTVTESIKITITAPASNGPTAPVYNMPTAPAYSKPSSPVAGGNMPSAPAYSKPSSPVAGGNMPSAPVYNSPSSPVEAPKQTVVVTPIQYTPAPTGSYVPVSPMSPPTYNNAPPAANGTASNSPMKPTYSAPAQYTGAGVKTAGAGFGALAMAFFALAL